MLGWNHAPPWQPPSSVLHRHAITPPRRPSPLPPCHLIPTQGPLAHRGLNILDAHWCIFLMPVMHTLLHVMPNATVMNLSNPCDLNSLSYYDLSLPLSFWTHYPILIWHYHCRLTEHMPIATANDANVHFLLTSFQLSNCDECEQCLWF
jgi:hypothetical protein